MMTSTSWRARRGWQLLGDRGRKVHLPERQCRPTRVRERVEAALHSDEPAIDVSQQNLRCIRCGVLEVARPRRPVPQRRRAGQRLLPIGRHYRLARAAANGGIAVSPPVLLDDAGPPLAIAPRTPGDRLNQYIHIASGRHAEQAEAEQAAKLAHARIVLAAATASRGTHRKPDLVARSGAVHGLQDEIEREGEFQLADHHGGGLLAIERDQVAAAHLAFHLEPELFEEAL